MGGRGAQNTEMKTWTRKTKYDRKWCWSFWEKGGDGRVAEHSAQLAYIPEQSEQGPLSQRKKKDEEA